MISTNIIRHRNAILMLGFVVSGLVGASQAGCTAFYDCIYVPFEGYRVCAELEPVLSVTRAGDPIEIVDELGNPPSGCTCMHPDTVPTFEANVLDPVLDPLHLQMQDDARAACESMALDLLADPSPCDTAIIDKVTATKDEGTTIKCLFSDGDIDDDPDCPPVGEDEVGFTTDDEASGTDTGETDEGGVVTIPDLPKQP